MGAASAAIYPTYSRELVIRQLTDFYPPPLPVPDRLASGRFVLVPLTPSHVELDYAAVMASRVMLRSWAGGSWPADDFTVQGNLEDLQRHDREHRERIAFTYTVLSADESLCLGCVYIKPLAMFEAGDSADLTPADRAATTRFWVRQPDVNGTEEEAAGRVAALARIRVAL